MDIRISPQVISITWISYSAGQRFFSIDQPVLDDAVRLRQQRRMSLGDAIVAGTARIHNLTLATHNVRDFAWIDGLAVMDPVGG